MEPILFWSLSGLVVLFAFLVITAKNPVHSAVFLIGALLNMAGLYILLDAEFLVGVQVIVYVGGITILYMFVIALITMKKIRLETAVTRQWPAALIAAGAFVVEATFFLLKGQEFFRVGPKAPGTYGQGSTEAIGRELFGHYVLPFEIATVLLLVAMVGAVIMSQRARNEARTES